jgi:tripartite-type tricarboxylate transporter receptor subunit TctC
MTHIPYKGSTHAHPDLISGRTSLMFDTVAAANVQIKADRLRALAVTTTKRSSVLPEVPTMQEAGVPGSEFNFWIGMMAPGKTPRDIVNRLHDEVVKALNTPEVKERFAALGADAWTLSPEQFDAYIKDEIKSNAVLVKAAGLQPAQ